MIIYFQKNELICGVQVPLMIVGDPAYPIITMVDEEIQWWWPFNIQSEQIQLQTE